uniref:Letm1 RBD domain-containing protein n=1 Tax=Mycena chlorophos TaxID=658473 RepID=A0ABQ0M308_MYCCL|nr:predicted protein [Mycena chlorophos]
MLALRANVLVVRRAAPASHVLYRRLQTDSPRSRPQPASHPTPVVKTEPSMSLGSLKETTARDIADAESHGVLAPPPPGAGWAKSTLHKVGQLLKFYYVGTRLVVRRVKVVKEIRARVQAGGDPLDRWEHRMLHTQAADIRKVPFFVLTALILEEVIPLIIIWAPGLLPSTCILPSQLERIHERAADKALALASTHGQGLKQLTKAADQGEIPLKVLDDADWSRVVCGLLGLSTSGLNFMRRQRIQRHLRFVEQDDIFLARDDVRSKLSAQDLEQALRERGIFPRGLDSTQQHSKLTWWLSSVHKQSDAIARRIYLVALMGSR